MSFLTGGDGARPDPAQHNPRKAAAPSGMRWGKGPHTPPFAWSGEVWEPGPELTQNHILQTR